MLLQILRGFRGCVRTKLDICQWNLLEHFRTWCIGWSTASAVQLGFGNETALATEVTETLPQALKRDPRIDGSYARLKACSTHRLYTICETAIALLKSSLKGRGFSRADDAS